MTPCRNCGKELDRLVYFVREDEYHCPYCNRHLQSTIGGANGEANAEEKAEAKQEAIAKKYETYTASVKYRELIAVEARCSELAMTGNADNRMAEISTPDPNVVYVGVVHPHLLCQGIEFHEYCTKPSSMRRE